MGVFGAQIQTSTNANGYPRDNVSPALGALNTAAMMSPSALSGTNGQCASLVHGDEWNQIENNRTDNILGNVKDYIKGNETYTVNGNLVYRVNGTTHDTRVQQHNQINISARLDVFIHTRSEMHYQPECREQKTADNESDNNIFHVDLKNVAWHLFMIDMFGIRMELNTTMNFEKKLLQVGGNIFVIEDRAFEVKMEEIKASLGGLASEIKAGKLKAAATHIKAIAGNINAGIALNADSPFG
jgi:hypothetical protein